jgi:antitoxin component of MazEF toxin-antitoxin module
MTRLLQKMGNSKGLLLTRTMLDHLGVTNEVEVSIEQGRIVITPPRAARRRQSYEEAKSSSFAQYDVAMKRLAEAG